MNRSMADLDMHRVRNIHLIGVGGCGVSGLARILLEMGFKVSGSDLREGTNTLRLKDLGVKILIGHDPSNVRDADLIVYSSAVKPDNVEILEAQAKGIKIIKRAEMLAWITNQSAKRIAVAGTHGKTTTTAMLARILENNQLQPTYFIGCDMDYAEGNAKLGQGIYSVAEADESDSSFLLLSPTIEVITNIEEDHMENFGNSEVLLDTFVKFAGNCAGDGFIAIDPTQPKNRFLMERVKARYVTYSLAGKTDLTADRLQFHNFTSRYDLVRNGKKAGEVELSVPGWQNILNSLGAFAVAFELGLEFPAIVSALRTFAGARRRFQTVGETDSVMVIDDYAHHPTEIKATLAAARAGWPDRRLICVFQPHRYTRTLLLKEQFADAFADADEVIITDIYAASEKPIPGVSGRTIADLIKGKNVNYVKRKEKVSEELLALARPGDIVLTLGAGDIYTVGKEFLSRLKLKENEISAA